MPPGLVPLALVEERPAEQPVHLVHSVGIAIVAARVHAEPAGGDHDPDLASVAHLLHQVEHARGAQVAHLGLEDPAHGGVDLVRRGGVLDAVVEEQARRLTGQALLGVVLEEVQDRLGVLVRAGLEELQVGVRELGLTDRSDPELVLAPVQGHLEAAQEVDPRDADDAVGVDLHHGFGPERHVAVEVDVRELDRADVAGGPPAAGRGPCVDAGVVHRRAHHQAAGGAVVPADRDPRHVVDQRQGRDDGAVVHDVEGHRRGGGVGLDRAEVDPAIAHPQGEVPVPEDLDPDGAHQGVLPHLGGVVLGEGREEVLVPELPGGHDDLEVAEVHGDRARLAVARLGLQPRRGLVGQLEAMAPLQLHEEVDRDPVRRRGEVAGDDESLPDDGDGHRPSALDLTHMGGSGSGGAEEQGDAEEQVGSGRHGGKGVISAGPVRPAEGVVGTVHANSQSSARRDARCSHRVVSWCSRVSGSPAEPP